MASVKGYCRKKRQEEHFFFSFYKTVREFCVADGIILPPQVNSKRDGSS
jgi:hypothetical protein